MTKIKPLRDFVTVRKIEPKQTSIIQLVKMDERLLQGEVVAVGTGVLTQNGQTHDIEVKVGELVVFDRMNATEVEHKGEKVFVVNELSIRAVLL